MSGWENVPEEAPTPPPARGKPAAATAEPDAGTPDADSIEDGELARLIDRYWPELWLAMLGIISVIGVWAAIGKLPNHPSWWP